MSRFGEFVGRFLGISQKSLTIQNIEENFYPVEHGPKWVGSQHTGLASNVVMAPVMWIMRTFTEAVARVERRVDPRLWEWVTDHPAEMLIDRPNDAYDGDALWKATCVSYVLNGNAYWRKVRNAFGAVVQLWYVPHWMMKPVWSRDGVSFIDHYEYQNGAAPPIPLSPNDVVHFRFGLDPENTRLGLSPMGCLLRDVLTDDRASQFSEVILRNMGVPGLVVSPKNENFKPSDEAVKEMRNFFRTSFSGERRGDPLVTKIPTEVTQFGFDPNKLMLGNLRDISEERVCAVIGIPAAVVGFGSGLQSTKVGATMRELRRLAWVQCLTPMQTSMGKQATAQLLPDFVAQTRRFRIRFDTSDVSMFPEDEAAREDRILKRVAAGVMRVDRAQAALGMEVDETQQVYLRPTTTAAVDDQGNVIPSPRETVTAQGGPTTAPTEPPADAATGAATDTSQKSIEIPPVILDRLHAVPNGNGSHAAPDEPAAS